MESIHYRVHRSLPQDSIHSQLYPIHTFATYLTSILILSSHLRPGLPSSLVSPDSQTKILHAFLSLFHVSYLLQQFKSSSRSTQFKHTRKQTINFSVFRIMFNKMFDFILISWHRVWPS